ncbi:MAG: MFS transporter [Alphaproteobacteria bacterium]|nr:MFS transporter [Alphaproteobacteria bacterium]
MYNLSILLGIGLTSQAVIALIAFTTPVMAVAAAPSFGLAAVRVGYFMTMVYFTAMFSAAAGGGLIARFGAIRTTQLCLILCVCGLLLTLAASVPLALFGALLIGAGYGPVTPASSHLLAPVTSAERRPLVFSLKQTSVPVGGALAGLIVPYIIGVESWQAAVILIAGIGTVTALAAQPFRIRCDAYRDRHAPLRLEIVPAVRGVLAQRLLQRLCVMSLAFAAVQLCFGAYFVTFLVERHGVALAAAGLAFTVGQIAGIVFRVIWGAVAGRAIAARWLLVGLAVAMAGACVATLALSAAWPLGAIAGVAALFGASAVAWNGLFLAEIVRVTSVAKTGAATGGALFFTFGGMTLGPALFGVLLGVGVDYGVAFSIVGGLALLSVFPLLRRER